MELSGRVHLSREYPAQSVSALALNMREEAIRKIGTIIMNVSLKIDNELTIALLSCSFTQTDYLLNLNDVYKDNLK